MKGTFREDRDERERLFRCRKDAVKDVLCREERNRDGKCASSVADGKTAECRSRAPASPHAIPFPFLQKKKKKRQD